MTEHETIGLQPTFFPTMIGRIGQVLLTVLCAPES